MDLLENGHYEKTCGIFIARFAINVNVTSEVILRFMALLLFIRDLFTGSLYYIILTEPCVV